MYTKLAVPLDGSPLAEQALPYALRLAILLKAQLLLVRLTEFAALPGVEFEQADDAIQQAELYLKKVKHKITTPTLQPFLPNDQVEVLTAYAKPPIELANLCVKAGADLLMMTTHGRSGLSRLLIGSVASQVIKHATIPVILLHPAPGERLEVVNPTEPLSFGRRIGPLLVTLDGSRQAEAALEPALELAKQTGAALHLLKVIVPRVPVQFGTDFDASYVYESFEAEKMLAMQGEAADQYLEKLQKLVGAAGLRCARNVQQGDPACIILDYAQQVHASLLVMATHARGRVGQILSGSVAAEVMRQSHLPVMMVRIIEELKPTGPSGT